VNNGNKYFSFLGDNVNKESSANKVKVEYRPVFTTKTKETTFLRAHQWFV